MRRTFGVSSKDFTAISRMKEGCSTFSTVPCCIFRKYRMALDAIEESEKPLTRHTKTTVGQAFINHLLETKRFSEAAALCPKIVGEI